MLRKHTLDAGYRGENLFGERLYSLENTAAIAECHQRGACISRATKSAALPISKLPSLSSKESACAAPRVAR